MLMSLAFSVLVLLPNYHRRCVDAIQFVQSGRFVNPSSFSPLCVNAKRTSLDGSKFWLNVDTSNFAIFVTNSFLQCLPSAGLEQKQVRGIVHS